MTKSALITFDSMRYPNSGFFSYGKSLGEALKSQNQKFDLTYFLNEKSNHKFDRVKSTLLPNVDGFDLIHFADQFTELIPTKGDGKKILTIHDLNPIHEKRPGGFIERHLDKIGGYIDECDQIVAISNFVAQDIFTYFPGTEHKVRVIYNGVDHLEVPKNHSPFYQPKKFLFTIGFNNKKKNFHRLIPLLVDNTYELLIAGVRTPYESVIMSEAKKFGVESRVKILGQITEEDKAWHYQNCSAFFLPSLAEGFGLPVIEAMYFGKPVFLSNLTALPEIGGDAAFYFDNFEPESMQKTFINGMESFSEEMRQKTISRSQEFNWEKTAQQYLALYDECLSDI